MKKMGKTAALLAAAAAVFALSLWGPEALARYRDKSVFLQVHQQQTGQANEGYRYTLSANQRLGILAAGLQSQAFSENSVYGSENLQTQQLGSTYAFVENQNGPTGREITQEQIYETCNVQLETFVQLGILPSGVKEVDAQSYSAVLYSAIDVPEPRNSVAVWKVGLSEDRNNTDKSHRLIDAYIDADSGKIYEFYVRTDLRWEDIDPDAVLDAWQEYMGLEGRRPFESDNPLLETTPYYKKYVFEGMDGGKTVVTVGFYEGIKELFLKIS